MNTPNEQQPTPRVDAFYWRETGINPIARHANEWQYFARQLERELAELQQINHILHNLMASGERRGAEKAAEELATERAAHARTKESEQCWITNAKVFEAARQSSEAKLKLATKDKERLDWLDSKQWKAETCVNSRDLPVWLTVTGGHYTFKTFQTIREAIDAEMVRLGVIT